MPAVANKKRGLKVDTKFAVTQCASCSGILSTLKESWRVKVVTFVGSKRRSTFAWYHRECVK